jgi:uncharacterized protein with gpF-like domain
MPDRLRAWLLVLDRFEVKLRAQVGRARNSAIIHAAQGYQYAGHVPHYIAEGHRKRLQQILAAHYEKVIPHFAAQALTGIKSRPVGRHAAALIESKSDVDFTALRQAKAEFEAKATDVFERLMKDWIAREALRKSTQIASTDMEDIRDAIADGVADGLGTAEIARGIRKVSQLTPFRAATVARTETHAAATFGSIESVRDAERELDVKMLKEWLPTLDDRTRPDHAAMAGSEPIPLDERFIVGGVAMDRPGDPGAPPEQTINCRCSLGYSEDTN